MNFPYQNPYPVLGANLSQQLFQRDEKLLVPSHLVSQEYQNLATVSGANSMPSLLHDTKHIMPAFLEQAHMSTLYQDNPWPILTASNKFGVITPGGDLIPNQPPGYRPMNTLSNNLSHSKEHFGNVESVINWG